MSELPAGWIGSTLDDLVDFNPKHSPSTSGTQTISFVPMPAVGAETGIIEAPLERQLHEVWKGFTHFANDDVIFAKITPCMENGKIAVARNLVNGVACGSTEFHVLRTRGAVLPEFLWRYLRQQSFRQDAEMSMTGAVGQRRVPTDYLRAAQLPLPPLAEQRRIVAKLDAVTARTARARADLDRIPNLVAKLKRSVLSAAFAGGMTRDWRLATGPQTTPVYNEPGDPRPKARRRRTAGFTDRLGADFPALPTGWTYRTVGALLDDGLLEDMADGNHGSEYPRKSEFGSSGVTFVSAAQVQDGVVDFDRCPRLNAQKAARLRKGWAKTGDVLLTHNATVGRTAYVADSREPFLLGTSVTYYRANPRLLSPIFLYWAMSAPIFQDQLASVMGQTTRNQVPIGRQSDLELPIPPRAEQDEIVLRIERSLSSFRHMGVEPATARRQLDRLDQALLAKAFRGELVPQDPGDEPASVLLDRIRAERAAAPAKARRGRPGGGVTVTV